MTSAGAGDSQLDADQAACEANDLQRRAAALDPDHDSRDDRPRAEPHDADGTAPTA